MTSAMGAVFDLNEPAHVVHWHFFQMSDANIAVIVAMLLVFALAILLPFPGAERRRAAREGGPHSPHSPQSSHQPSRPASRPSPSSTGAPGAGAPGTGAPGTGAPGPGAPGAPQPTPTRIENEP